MASDVIQEFLKSFVIPGKILSSHMSSILSYEPLGIFSKPVLHNHKPSEVIEDPQLNWSVVSFSNLKLGPSADCIMHVGPAKSWRSVDWEYIKIETPPWNPARSIA